MKAGGGKEQQNIKTFEFEKKTFRVPFNLTKKKMIRHHHLYYISYKVRE